MTFARDCKTTYCARAPSHFSKLQEPVRCHGDRDPHAHHHGMRVPMIRRTISSSLYKRNARGYFDVNYKDIKLDLNFYYTTTTSKKAITVTSCFKIVTIVKMSLAIRWVSGELHTFFLQWVVVFYEKHWFIYENSFNFVCKSFFYVLCYQAVIVTRN